jgi:hypothetical protein
MKKGPSDRKGNYASIVKENMRMIVDWLGANGRKMPQKPQYRCEAAKERA